MTEGGSSASLVLSCKLHGVKILCVCEGKRGGGEENKKNRKTN
jgi:hypothetical protein